MRLCFSWNHQIWACFKEKSKFAGIKKKEVFGKSSNFLSWGLKKDEGRSPSHFLNVQFENLISTKSLSFFLDFCDFWIFPWNQDQIWWLHEKHNLETKSKFDADWVTICFFKKMISKCLEKEKIEAFWVCGGLFESHQNRLHQEISCQLFEILRCAFNVLSDVEKMSYLDVRNGVGKFRICTFWGGG